MTTERLGAPPGVEWVGGYLLHAPRTVALLLTTLLLVTAVPAAFAAIPGNPPVGVMQSHDHQVCGTNETADGNGTTCADQQDTTLVHASEAGAFVNLTLYQNRTVSNDTRNSPSRLRNDTAALAFRSYAPTPVGRAHANVTVTNETRDASSNTTAGPTSSHEERVGVRHDEGLTVQVPLPGWNATVEHFFGSQAVSVTSHRVGAFCTLTVAVRGVASEDLPCPPSGVPPASSLLP